jgi:ABC-type glycerol-3-phosphate transport system substrate-binding protein
MKGFKKLLAALVLAATAAGAFSACGGPKAGQSATPAPSVLEQGGAPVYQGLNFTWYKNYDWYSAEHWANEAEGEQWIRDKFGIHIEFRDAGGDANQKLATMMLDRQYPDVLSLDRDANLQKLIAMGAVVPLDPYLEKYPNLKTYLGEGTLNLLRAPDGKLYSFPNWAAPIGDLSGNAGWLVQEKYYNALGRPPLATYDDLYAYLLQLKAAYPGVTPLGLSPRFESADVLYGGMKAGNVPAYITEHLYMDGGTLKTALASPEYQETLLFVNKLYRERLVSQDLFTMTDDTLQEQIRNGLVGVLCLKDIFDSSMVVLPNYELKQEDPSFNLAPIPPVVKAGEDVNKVYTNSSNATGWNVSVITKDAKDPEKIFAFLDWWFGSLGQLVTTLGVPGKYWVEGAYSTQGSPEMTNAFFTATNEEIDAEWCDTNWVGNTAFVNNMARYIYEQTGYAQQLKLDQFNFTWNHSVDTTELTYVQPDLDSDLGILWQTLDGIYLQGVPEITLAPSEGACRAAIDKYVQELASAGTEELLAYQQGVISANLSKMGRK